MTGEFKLALHTWTIDTTPLEVALDAGKAAGFDAMELRASDIAACMEKGQSLTQIIETIRNSGIQLGILGTEYGWFFAPPDERARLFDVLRQTCEIAVACGCGLIMSAPGQLVGTVEDAIAATKIAGEIVGEYGLRLALEFNSQHPVVNRTPVLREIIEGAGQKSCGMLLDAYHLHRSQGIAEGLRGVRSEELFVFQYSDSPAVPTPGIKRPIDRLPPGDGVIDWNELFDLLSAIGYRGYLSYEAPNPELWHQSPHVVAVDGIRKMRELYARQRILSN